MMRLTILMIAMFIASIAGKAQESYSDYNNSHKKYILNDNFSSNNTGWWIGENKDRNSGRLSNGNYEYQSISGKNYTSTKKIPINQSKDFQIECTFKIGTTIQTGKISAHLLWGRSNDNKIGYNYAIRTDKKYVVYDNNNGKFTHHVKFATADNYKLNDYNKLTIRKVNNYYYFFINEKFISKIDFKPFFGDRIGFLIGGKVTLFVDKLEIAYLSKQDNPTEIIITEPQVSRGFKVVQVENILVKGKAIDKDGIKSVFVNDKQATLQSNGDFSVNAPLKFGDNTIKVKVVDNKGNTENEEFTIKRENIAKTEKRVALIIGNSNYTGAASLGQNPINDANDMSNTLKSIGFEVITKIDANLSEMTNAIREFGQINKDADVALFFFAGHGMQVDKTNYILPIGLNINNKDDISFECISVDLVQKTMESSNSNRLNLIILDACRNNPFRTWERGGESGLADVTPPSGTLIAFATSPGSTASNGVGKNGLYTGELISQLKIPQRIEDVFINTRIEVEEKSGGQQSPWELARLRGKYYLVK